MSDIQCWCVCVVVSACIVCMHCTLFVLTLLGMSNILKRRLLYKQYKYVEPNNIALSKKTERLPPEAWQPLEKDDTVHLKGVQSTKQAAHFYSPAAQNIPVAWSDVILKRHMLDKQDYTIADNVWIGILFKCNHHTAFRYKSHIKTAYIGLGHYKDSCVMVWPAEVRNVPGTTCKVVAPDKTCEEPMLLPIYDVSQLEVFHFKFRAYASLCKEFKNTWHKFRPGIFLSVCRCVCLCVVEAVDC